MTALFCAWIFVDEDWEMLDMEPVHAAAIPAIITASDRPVLFLRCGEVPP
jgi:hypothetical protein